MALVTGKPEAGAASVMAGSRGSFDEAKTLSIVLGLLSSVFGLILRLTSWTPTVLGSYHLYCQETRKGTFPMVQCVVTRRAKTPDVFSTPGFLRGFSWMVHAGCLVL